MGVQGLVRYRDLVSFLLPALLAGASIEAGAAPQPFMDLYHDFTGVHDGSARTIGQELADALEKKERMGRAGPLVLVIESGIYVYDHETRKLLAKISLRSDDPRSGFYEMTAVSHVGPAVAYLANLKELGDPCWREGLEKLQTDLEAVRQVNAVKEDHWLDSTSSLAMKMKRQQVIDMVDYGCCMAGSYIRSVLDDGGKNFTVDSVSRDFYNVQSAKFPIPFKNVMVGTFAMVALSDYYNAYLELRDKPIDWSKARVLIQFHAGTNYGGGLTKGSNHLYQFLKLVSGGKLPESRMFFTPYAGIRASAGQVEMSREDFDFYTKQVWYHQYARPRVAVSGCFKNIGTIFLPERPALPGDRDYSSPDAIDDFMMRMKYSLGDNTQLLSNTIGFWMSEELARHDWDPNKVAIPGVTSGFPGGLSGYPAKSPCGDK
ncbi:MAG: DUF5624 domain-containing protein [Candidatus Obscuribacterales bacterium]